MPTEYIALSGFALMEQVAPVFARMAQLACLPAKGAYTIKEVSKASSIAYTTLCEEVRIGELKAFLPPGRERGWLVKPEWFDDYWNGGEHAG